MSLCRKKVFLSFILLSFYSFTRTRSLFLFCTGLSVDKNYSTCTVKFLHHTHYLYFLHFLKHLTGNFFLFLHAQSFGCIKCSMKNWSLKLLYLITVHVSPGIVLLGNGKVFEITPATKFRGTISQDILSSKMEFIFVCIVYI